MAQHPNAALADLFMSLFTVEELKRFVTLTAGTSLLSVVDFSGSLSQVTFGLVEALQRRALLDDAFDSLMKERPERVDDIEAVRELFRGESTTSDPTDQPSPLDAEEQAFANELQALFAQPSEGGPTSPADAWLSAAAVLDKFDPTALEPASPDPTGYAWDLADLCNEHRDGRWSLRLEVRREWLAKLWGSGELQAALAANAEVDPEHGEWLRRAADGPAPNDFELRSLSPPRLAALTEVTAWLELTDADIGDRDLIAALAERQRRIAPLRRLVGEHFRGRVDDIEELENHTVAPSPNPRIRVVWGQGGTGKSALLGALLLKVDRYTEFPVPWVYLDCDDPSLPVLDGAGLIERIARELSLLYTTHPAANDFGGLESALAGDRATYAEPFDGIRGSTLAQMCEVLADALRQLPTSEPPFLVVVDTFEQVQARGERAVAFIREVLDALAEAYPQTRAIVCGRARVPQWIDVATTELPVLPRDDAQSVLGALGVADTKLRELIVDRLGRSPLTLRLAARAVKKAGLDEKDVLTMSARLSALMKARELQVQGRLYNRILGHIRDNDVKSLAHPGLVVRRVTPGVIAEVLADFCGVPAEKAGELFGRLGSQVDMFEPDETAADEPEALRHRQDVRENMLRLAKDEGTPSKDVVDAIHQRAIEFYAGRSDAIAVSETIYHRLMLDDPPTDIDSLDAEVAARIGRSWDEPLPKRARAWLGPKIGRGERDESQWSQAEWEAHTANEVRLHIETRDYQGALRLLHERSDRLPGSELRLLEARAQYLLGAHDEARKLVAAALDDPTTSDDPKMIASLALLGARASRAAGAIDDVRHYVELVQGTPRAPAETELEALEVLVRAEEESSGTADDAKDALMGKFVRADDEVLDADQARSVRIMATLGPTRIKALRKGAKALANRAEIEAFVPDAFKLQRLLELVGKSGPAKSRLRELAGSVGLDPDDFDYSSLASNAIRYERFGDAMAIAIDHGDDDADAGVVVADLLNPKLINLDVV